MRTLMRSILLTAALLLGVAAHAQWVGYQFISRSTDGTQVGGGGRAQVTPNGRFVVYVSTATQLVTPFTSGWQVFLFDRWKNTTELISQNDAGQFGDGTSDLPSISDDGCRVVFHSYASNLAGGAIGGTGHVYLRERCTSPARTRMVSTTAAGAVGNASSGPPRISGNGRYAAFHTYATNIVAYTGGGAVPRCA